jgi:hypothetical protein
MMQASQSRWTFVIALTMAVLGALIVWLAQSRATDEVPATALAPRVASAAEPPVITPSPTLPPVQAAKQVAAPAAAPDESVGTASSAIHFERAAKKPIAAASIDVNAKFAVGVWRPADRWLRVLLLEKEPKPGEAAALRDALPTLNPTAPPVTPAGVIDLRFMATAQAFDRSELESASLTVTNTRGDSNTADVLGSLEWHGSLPAPRTEGAPPMIRLQMGAIGSSTSADREAWKQEWNFHLMVPIAVVD